MSPFQGFHFIFCLPTADAVGSIIMPLSGAYLGPGESLHIDDEVGDFGGDFKGAPDLAAVGKLKRFVETDDGFHKPDARLLIPYFHDDLEKSDLTLHSSSAFSWRGSRIDGVEEAPADLQFHRSISCLSLVLRFVPRIS
jgi:hypothetical protein